MAVEVDARLKKGIELFNAGEFFESHEIIEDLWRSVRDENSDFYKGLIQAAAGFHHVKKGNINGALLVLGSSLRYLGQFPDRHFGLDVKKLRAEIERWHQVLLTEKSKSKTGGLKLHLPRMNFHPPE